MAVKFFHQPLFNFTSTILSSHHDLGGGGRILGGIRGGGPRGGGPLGGPLGNGGGRGGLS